MKMILLMTTLLSLSACDRSPQEETIDPNWEERQEEIEMQEEQEQRGRTSEFNSDVEDVENLEN